MFNKKRGITPVVATALLLVITVISVVTFQGWFTSFFSSVLVETESDSSTTGLSTTIEAVVGSNLYFKNGYANISIETIEIDSVSCGITPSSYSSGMLEINLGNCTQNISKTVSDVVVFTNVGIFTKKYVLQDISLGSQSSSLSCNSSYVLVPGDSAYGTSDFCIMKYEARFVGGVATSQPTGTLAVLTTQPQARNNCSSLGSGYHLTTENEWLTIAKNLEQVSSNWNSSVVGTGFIYSGHNDDSPSSPRDASLNDSDGYFNTGQTTGSQRRTLNLSNGNIIWDFAGNVFEWTNDTIAVGARYEGGGTGTYTYNAESGQTNTTNVPSLMRPSNGWDGDEGMGRYSDGNNALAYEDASGCGPGFCSSTAAYLRGGSHASGVEAGIYGLNLNLGPNRVDTKIGFRCTYTG